MLLKELLTLGLRVDPWVDLLLLLCCAVLF